MHNPEEDAAYIIRVFRKEGIDYKKVWDTMILLMYQIEEHRQIGGWSECEYYCEQLRELAESPDMQDASEIDTRYMQGIAQMYRGAMFLSRGQLGSAIECFSNSQRFFHAANTLRGEAVALLALGIACQRQCQSGTVESKKRDWAEILTTLQRSLVIFQNLKDKLEIDVLDRLAEVRELCEGDLKTEQFQIPSKVAQPSTAKNPGKIIPVVARIAAGEPILAEQNIKDHIVVDDEIADRINFALEVQGDSMVGAGILPGDLILMEKREDLPSNGQVVAITVTQDDEAVLKRFYSKGDHIRLEPANDSYPFVIIKPNSLSEAEIRACYERSHPNRFLEIHSGVEPQVAGWARALIRKEVK